MYEGIYILVMIMYTHRINEMKRDYDKFMIICWNGSEEISLLLLLYVASAYNVFVTCSTSLEILARTSGTGKPAIFLTHFCNLSVSVRIRKELER